MTEQIAQKVRTRIAPSPTGFPHIGTIYQALFNLAYAKKNSGHFIVRIEDTDRNRFVEGSEDVIYQSLDWTGLTEVESPRKNGEFGPYRQSERLEIYHKYAEELVKNEKAYFSFFPKQDAGQKKSYTQNGKVTLHKTAEAPPSSINEMIKRENWIIRMRVPKNEKVIFKDQIRGKITFDTSEITDQVLIKSDGFPTYHLAVVVDDHLMQISHIVRAEEWLSSTPKHVLLYKYFGWVMPPIYHTATLRNPDKSKLSKRQGHTNVLWFKEEGYLPEALLNFLALLGWSHPEEKEIFSFGEFVELFDLNDIRPVAPIFDLNKLNWMNQQYIQKKSDSQLKKLVIDFCPKAGGLAMEVIDKLIPLVKTRMTTLKDFEKLSDYFFAPPDVKIRNDKEKLLVKDLYMLFNETHTWSKDIIFGIFKSILNSHEIKMPVVYCILTGREKGLPLPESLEILGKKEVQKRLEKILSTI